MSSGASASRTAATTCGGGKGAAESRTGGVIEANERRVYGRTFATEFGNPGFVELARAFGIAGFAVPTARELFPILRRALDLGEPALVAVPWDHRQNERIADKIG